MFGLFNKKKEPKVVTSYVPLPYWVTGPVPNLEIWKDAVMPAGRGPIEGNEFGTASILLAGNPALYRFID